MAPEGPMAMILASFCIVAFVSTFDPHEDFVQWSTWELISSEASSMIDFGGLPDRATDVKNAYKGIPIEFPVPDRRSLGVEDDVLHTNETSTTSPAHDPDSIPRVRRIFNVDALAFIEENKFLAALLLNKQLWCGAVIIDSDKVLTAAHCLQLQYKNRFVKEYVRMLLVRIGSNNATAGGKLYRVSDIIFHPKYNPETLEFNAALMLLRQNISFEKEALDAEKIPYSRDKDAPANNNVTFLGWGSVGDVGGDGGAVLLQTVKLPVSNLTDCQEVYGRKLVTSSNFCAGFKTLPKNVCNHDAGGPAVLDGILVGILSFSTQRCDVMEKPVVFTNVGSIADWLEEVKNSTVTVTKRRRHLAHHPSEATQNKTII